MLANPVYDRIKLRDDHLPLNLAVVGYLRFGVTHKSNGMISESFPMARQNDSSNRFSTPPGSKEKVKGESERKEGSQDAVH